MSGLRIDWPTERARMAREFAADTLRQTELFRASLRLCAEGERNIRTRELECSR